MTDLYDDLAEKLEREPTSGELAAKYELDEDFDLTDYTPPGPVSRAFLTSMERTSFIMGPLGGGKTTACVMKRALLNAAQPVINGGWKMDRLIVVRDTFRNAEKTVLDSWKEWFPKNYAGSDWQGGNDRPVTHTLRFASPDGKVKHHLETVFMGLNGEDVESKMRGWPLTHAWMNEADTTTREAMGALEKRLGRYPTAKLIGNDEVKPTGCLIGDFNAPDMDNWTYEDFVAHPTPGRVLFQQPGGLDPMAENVHRLPENYYQNIIDNEDDWYTRRFVFNEFGFSRHGLPVYVKEFRQQVHVARQRLAVDPDMPILIGGDPGMSNAALVIAQPTAQGQIRVLREIVPGQGYGATAIGWLLVAMLNSDFRACSKAYGWLDPAGSYGGGHAQLTWMEEISGVTGIPFQIPGDGNNDPMRRVGAVRKELLGRIDGETPQIIFCPFGCPMLVRGAASGYRYKKRKNTDGSQHKYELLPEKNSYSHPHDALQYVVIGYRGHTSVLGAGTGWKSQSTGGASAGGFGGKRGSFNPHKVG